VFARHRNLWFEEQKLARLNGNNSECVSAFGVDVGIGRDWLVVSSASAFAFLLGTPIAYQRTAAGFLPRWALLGDDVNTAVIEMTGSTVFTGFPFDRGFSTGTVPLYDLSASVP
jgi:hypothetical protein